MVADTTDIWLLTACIRGFGSDKISLAHSNFGLKCYDERLQWPRTHKNGQPIIRMNFGEGASPNSLVVSSAQQYRRVQGLTLHLAPRDPCLYGEDGIGGGAGGCPSDEVSG